MLELLLGLFVFLFVAYVTKELLRRLDSRLPPGPWGLPVVGYSPYLSDRPHEDYCKLAKKYGPVFGLYLGTQYTVILGDFASIKEAFNKEEFLDRPVFLQGSTEENIVTMNGWKWKETRRFVLSTFRQLGMGKNKLEQRILEEVNIDIDKLEKLGPDAEVDMEDFFLRAFANNIFSIINGLNLEDSSNILPMVQRFKNLFVSSPFLSFVLFKIPSMAFIIPLLQKIGYNPMENKEIDTYIRGEIKSHEENLDPSNKEDFLDYYLEEMKKSEGKKTSFNYPNLVSNAQVLLSGGMDTTLTALKWIFLCLAKHKELQQKVYEEIRNLLGTEKPASWSDKDSLPYTYAFIMEVQRCYTIGPASDPHCAGRSGTIGGHHIPEGTTLLANIYAVHNDPKLWGDPENFRPDRFVSEEGKLITPEYWMPFLTGKRMCPGEKLAIMQMYIFVTSIVQKFKIVPPKSGLSLEGINGLIFFAAKPVVSFQRRD